MLLSNRLKIRSDEEELMDDFSMGGTDLQEALHHLRRLNRIFANAKPTIYGVNRLWEEKGRPKQLSILDVGCGSGDVNKHVLEWADKNEVKISIQLIDVTEEACEEARRLFPNEPRIQVKQMNVHDLPAQSVDIVTASQFVHHFKGEQLANVVVSMQRASRLGVVINDIHRHWLAYSAVWVTTRLISRNRYIRHDGPLSVARGFTKDDWVDLEKSLGSPGLHYSWRPLFRYAVIAPAANGRISTGGAGM